MPDDDAKTISSTATANYDWEEVETSLTNIAEAFHTIAKEYEKLTSTIPHMSKVQAAQVIARLPLLPALKQELKAKKMETAKMTETEPMPGTSQELPAAEAERPAEVPPEEVIIEPTAEGKEDESNEENVNKYFKKYVLTGKGKGPEEKIQEACKEINYQNLVILITVGDYIVNKAMNIKEVTKKWSLSFSAGQEKPTIGREMDNRTSQSQKPTPGRTKPRLLRQQGATRCTLGMDLKSQKKKLEDPWNTNLELPPPPPHHIRIPDHETVPQPMRPEPDPGNIPQSRTWMIASPWTRQCHKTHSFSGPPHPPKGKNLKS